MSTPDLLSDLGAALRAARARCGLTQTAVGDAVGVGGAMISRYENGTADPPASTLLRLAGLLELDLGGLSALTSTRSRRAA